MFTDLPVYRNGEKLDDFKLIKSTKDVNNWGVGCDSFYDGYLKITLFDFHILVKLFGQPTYLEERPDYRAVGSKWEWQSTKIKNVQGELGRISLELLTASSSGNRNSYCRDGTKLLWYSNICGLYIKHFDLKYLMEKETEKLATEDS